MSPKLSVFDVAERWTEGAFTGLGRIFVYLLCRVAFIELSLKEVRAGRYLNVKDTPTHVLDSGQAEFLFKTQREDSSHTDDKIKQLLTLSSSLATIILAFVRDVHPQWLVVLVLAVLFACVYLCISVLEVRSGQQPTPGEAAQGDDAELKNRWAHDLVSSLYVNQRAHAYRVDRYRAASRYFRLAFLLTPVLAWQTIPRLDTAAEQSAAALHQAAATERLRSAIDTLGVRMREKAGPTVNPRPAASAPRAGKSKPLKKAVPRDGKAG